MSKDRKNKRLEDLTEIFHEITEERDHYDSEQKQRSGFSPVGTDKKYNLHLNGNGYLVIPKQKFSS